MKVRTTSGTPERILFSLRYHCMTSFIRTTRAVVVALSVVALATAACGDPTSPETLPLSDLRQLHVAPDSPPLAQTQVSFYAVKGQPAGADLWYHARPGQLDSLKLVEFRMGRQSLDRRPDGTPIATGDSVLITLTAIDPTHLTVDFQPSGLTFSASDQPTLRLFWVACGEDLNYDGAVNEADSTLALRFSIWRQEVPGDPWTKVPSLVTPGIKEVASTLGGFTGYAILYERDR